VVYDLLFRTSAATLLEVAANAKHLGAQIGFLSVLHTWGQNLLHHPHVHCVIPGGGLSLDGKHWVRLRYAFSLPVKVLSRVFRGKFIAGLKRAFRDGGLSFPGSIRHLADEKAFTPSCDRSFIMTGWSMPSGPSEGQNMSSLSGTLHTPSGHFQS
jgi:Putative transposase